MRLRTKRRIAWLVLFSLEMGLVLHPLLAALILVGMFAGLVLASYLQARKDRALAEQIASLKRAQHAATPTRRVDDHRTEPRRLAGLGDLDDPKQPKGRT